MKVGFIGLGRMGEVMTRRLLEGGHEVGVYNRTPAKTQAADRRRRQGGRLDQSRGDFRRRGVHHGVRRRRGSGGRRPGRRLQGLAAEGRRSYLRRHPQRRRHREAQSDPRRGRADPDRLADARPAGSRHRGSGRHRRRRSGGGRCAAAAVIHRHRAARDRCRRRAGRRRASSRSPTISCSAAPSRRSARGSSLVRKYGVAPDVFYRVLTEGLFNCWAYKTYGKFIVDERYLPAGQRAVNGLKDANLALAAGEAAGVPLPQRQRLARPAGRRRRARRGRARLGGDGQGSGARQRAGLTSAPAERSVAGRGTMRSLVEGACGNEARLAADAPSTALTRGPPSPLRGAGKIKQTAPCGPRHIAWS